MAYVDLEGFALEPETVAAIPADNANAYGVVPIEYEPSRKKLKIAMKSPDNFRAVDDLACSWASTSRPWSPTRGSSTSFWRSTTPSSESVVDVVSTLAEDEQLSSLEGRGESIDLDAVMEAADDNQIVKLLNLVLLQAIGPRVGHPFRAV